jgi:hypothetical protein
MKNRKFLFFGISFLFLLAIFSNAVVIAATVTVPGTSDPWLAGMPNGSLDNVATPEPADVAPAQSPVLVTGITIGGGTTLKWNATGQVGHPGDPAGPDGYSLGIYSRYIGANNGISDITAPIDSLLGVFLGPGQPDLNPVPGALNFSTLISQDFISFSPAMQQVFFMGDGLTSGNIAQTIIAPVGATRLFLGTMDGYGWANNSGSFDVTLEAVPEPTTLLFLGSSLLGLFGFRRRFRK